MATGTIHRHAHRGRHHLRDHVIQIERPGGATENRTLGFFLSDEIPRARGEKSGGDHGVVVVRPENVTGDLFPNEAVVWLVFVQCLDHVVAIAPGMRTSFVAFEAVRVRIVRDVQPMPRVPFTEVR